MTTLPAGLLLAFYGDDFTGSTDAMEVMAFSGIKTVLFTKTPSSDDLAAFRDYQAVGIAGTARARSPDWMDDNLPSAFRALASLRPPILHYKVCSTFDSAPGVGSIGRAIDIGMALTGSRWCPSVVGAPQLRRWQAFANLFAGVGGRRYRIDHHPTMSRHPVTPMLEADLRRHLALQTRRPIGSIDIVDMAGADIARRVEEEIEREAVAFLDVVDEGSQIAAGRIVWENRGESLFTASSSGLQYALVAYWRSTGQLCDVVGQRPKPAPVDRLLVLSGSCSPMTAEQIACAEGEGFASVRADVRKLSQPEERSSEIGRLVDEGGRALQSGRSLVIYAAKTVDDEAFLGLKAFCEENGLSFSAAQAGIGSALGDIAATLLARHDLRRVVVAGGDTSGRVVEALPIKALEAVHPLATGAPICRVHSDEPTFDGLDLVLKGGQTGERDLLVRAKGHR